MAHAEAEDLIGTLVSSPHLFIIAVIGVKEKLPAATSGSQLTYPQLKVLKLLQFRMMRAISGMWPLFWA